MYYTNEIAIKWLESLKISQKGAHLQKPFHLCRNGKAWQWQQQRNKCEKRKIARNVQDRKSLSVVTRKPLQGELLISISFFQNCDITDILALFL